MLNSNYTCACNLPYEGDGFTCESMYLHAINIFITLLILPTSKVPVSDPCSSSPCDTNAVCTQSSDSSYTCTCSPPYGGDGFTCQSKSYSVVVSTPIAQVYNAQETWY